MAAPRGQRNGQQRTRTTVRSVGPRQVLDGGSLPRVGGRRRAWLWLELLVAGVAALGLLLLVIGGIVASTGADGVQSSRGGDIAAIFILLGALLLCTRWLIRIEHRLRGLEPLPPPTWRRMPARRALTPRGYRGRRGFHGPVARALGAVGLATLAIMGITGAIVDHSLASRSAYVQRHGTRAWGTVADVINHANCGRRYSNCSYTADIDVWLPVPVDGVNGTTVHYSAFSFLTTGQRVLVAVDPRQPGYAELPGAPYESASSWIIMLVIAIIAVPATVLDIRWLLRRRARRRGRSDSFATGWV